MNVGLLTVIIYSLVSSNAPGSDDFELLDGERFDLLDGSNFLLLSD